MKTRTIHVIACIATLLAATGVHAATYSWVGSAVGAWDTSASNWNDGTSGTPWANGNAAVFNGFGTANTITLGTDVIATSLTTNSTGGTTTVNLQGSTFSIDVSTITVNTTSIDLFAKITGNHGLTINATGAARLNLKRAADYTGDTFLSTGAYLLIDGANNSLPTATTVNMVSGTTFRLALNNLTQEIAGLSGTGTVNASSTGNILTLNTKSSTTTTYTGAITGFTGVGGKIEVKGSGTQALNGTNSFSGSTLVSGGTLSLGSSLSASSSVTISGGTLTSTIASTTLGTGAVSMSSGEISARGAAAAGTFTVAANQSFTTTGGKLTFNIGTASDQIIGSGTGSFNIGNTTELALILGSGFSYANTYTLFSGFTTGTSVVGSGITITGYDTTNYVASLSTAGVLSFSATAVPEPSTYATLAGAVVLGFTALRRRTRR